MIKNITSIEETDNGFLVQHNIVEVDEDTGKVKRYNDKYCIEGRETEGVGKLLKYLADFYGEREDTIKISWGQKEAEKQELIKNISMLRQWLNEDRITDVQKIVSSDDLLHWLKLK